MKRHKLASTVETRDNDTGGYDIFIDGELFPYHTAVGPLQVTLPKVEHGLFTVHVPVLVKAGAPGGPRMVTLNGPDGPVT